MSSEVLIYFQKIKNYLSTNEEAKNYFLNGLNPNDFYNEIILQSEKNFVEKGDPMLTRDQFELIKENLQKPKSKEEKIFIDLKDFGKICLN